MKILVFTRKSTDKPKVPKSVLDRINVEHIAFETNDMNQLLKIARFRIINFPTSVIIDGRGTILMKVKGAIPESYIASLMELN